MIPHLHENNKIFIMYQSLLEEKQVSSALIFSFIIKLSLLWDFQLSTLYKTRRKLKQKVYSMQ